MTLDEITRQALALPFEERAKLAQTLWESIEDNRPTDAPGIIRDAVRRNREMDSRENVTYSHDEVMQAARRAIEGASHGTR